MNNDYSKVHNDAIFSVVCHHLVLALVVAAFPIILFGGDFILWIIVGVIAAAIYFALNRAEFRFEVPENSVFLVTWDKNTYSCGSGVWWKSIGADVKEDNKYSTERKTFSGSDSIPCKDGSRLEAKYGVQYFVTDPEIFNLVGQKAAEAQVKAHTEKFFGDIAKNGGNGLPESEVILLKKGILADQFELHFESDNAFIVQLSRRFGVKVELGYFETPIDYDAGSKTSLAKRFEKQKESDAAQYRRQSVVSDAQASGIADPKDALRIMAAIDGESDVSITGFDLSIAGLSDETVQMLAKLLESNPGALAGLATLGKNSKGKKQ